MPFTVQVSVLAGNDDAEEADDGTSFTRTGSTLTPVSSATDFIRNNVGLRFIAIGIPKGSNIIAATLDVDIVNSGSDDMHVDILAEAVADAVDFLATADVTSRARTTTSVLWSVADLGQGIAISPDFAAVVQEVVNLPTWSSNAMVIFLDGLTAPEIGSCIMAPFEHATGAPAQLTITYETTRVVPSPAAFGPNVVVLPAEIVSI